MPPLAHRRALRPRSLASFLFIFALALVTALPPNPPAARALDDGLIFAGSKLMPGSLAALDHFGQSVALRGERVIVGDPLHNQVGDNSGAAFLFKRVDGNWVEEAKLLSVDLAPLDEFGTSVALGRYSAIVGSPLHNAVGNNSGSAYIFKRFDGKWAQQAELLANDLAPFDDFGRSVAIHGDTAVVGAPLHNAVGSDSGAAYVFRWIDSKWVQEAKLLPSDLAPLDSFGASVAISKDTIVVGAPLRNDVGDNSGTAYVFTRHYSIWTQQAKLTALDLAPLDEFGTSVSVYKDRAVIGAPLHNERGNSSGAVYVFRRDGAKWMQEAKLLPQDLAPLDHFGADVSIDGSAVIAGSPLRNDVGDNSGAAYLFRRFYSKWTQEAKITASDLAPLDGFGTSVDLSWDSAVVGSPFRNDVGNNSGAAYVFPGMIDPCKGDAMYDYAMYGDDGRTDDCDAPAELPPPPPPGGGGGGFIISFKVDLLRTGADADATAVASFRAEGDDLRFELAAQRLSAGDYDVVVGDAPPATLAVGAAESGKLQIEGSAAPSAGEPEPGLDPRGKHLEICRGDEVFLAVDFPATLEEARRMARGIRIRAALEALEEGSPARGTFEYRSRRGRDQAKVNLRDVVDERCVLRVGGVEVGGADVIRGRANFDFDSVPGKGKQPLDFDPRGQLVQVLQGGEVVLQTIFPPE